MKLCGAKTRTGGECGKTAGWGTDSPGYGRCRLHGGNTPSGKKAAKEEQARQAVVSYGLARSVEPHAALLEELHRTAGHVAWLQQKVYELGAEHGDDALHGPVGGGQGAIPEEKPNIWLGLYQEERKHFAHVAKTCIAVGIEERRVQLAEQQGQLIAQVLRGVLQDLGVADRPEVPSVVRKHLSLVSAA